MLFSYLVSEWEVYPANRKISIDNLVIVWVEIFYIRPTEGQNVCKFLKKTKIAVNCNMVSIVYFVSSVIARARSKIGFSQVSTMELCASRLENIWIQSSELLFENSVLNLTPCESFCLQNLTMLLRHGIVRMGYTVFSKKNICLWHVQFSANSLSIHFLALQIDWFH